MCRIIGAFHKSGISGVDDPLNDKTVYFRKGQADLKARIQSKSEHFLKRQRHQVIKGGQSSQLNEVTHKPKDFLRN